MTTATASPVPIGAAFDFAPRFVKVDGVNMHYIDTGAVPGGPTVLFLHGNPTSSYLWRNIIPHVAPHARCIAPDLVGFGRSEKPKEGLRYERHVRNIAGFVSALVLDKVVLVVHDWGSAIGLEWARRHESRVLGIVAMELIAPVASWNDWPEGIRPLFQAFRQEKTNRELIIEQNVFIEQVLPGAVARGLSEAEMEQYRRPFLDPASRASMARFPTELPIEGTPADNVEVITAYMDWLTKTQVPKLLFWGTPGILVTPEIAAKYRKAWPNLRDVDIGPALHYVQEDAPDLIGKTIAEWLPRS